MKPMRRHGRASGWLMGLLCAAALLVASAVSAAPLVSGQPARYVYTDGGYFADKPLNVYYYKARQSGPNAPVLIALHGNERQGKHLRDAWIAWAEAHGAIVLAPEFDKARFPQPLYQLGNLRDADRSHWTLALVDRLFDALRRDEPQVAPQFMLFGHSAGAQFVHRYMLWTPAAHVSVAVAANAGSYTWPVLAGALAVTSPAEATKVDAPQRAAPPYTLDPARITPDDLRAALQRRLVLMLGEADVLTDQPNLPQAREARQQGANRLERGRAFFAAAQAQAQALGVPLAWQIIGVPGVGHDADGMGRAAESVFEANAQPPHTSPSRAGP